MKTPLIVVQTDVKRDRYKIVPPNQVDAILDKAIDIDSGTISEAMGLPRKYWGLDCDILVVS